jgi:hypothetical protein
MVMLTLHRPGQNFLRVNAGRGYVGEVLHSLYETTPTVTAHNLCPRSLLLLYPGTFRKLDGSYCFV